jgi:hypothetical protein
MLPTCLDLVGPVAHIAAPFNPITAATIPMPLTPITEADRLHYRAAGYFIIRQVIPAGLLRDLRREAAKAHDLAVRLNGPQTQRLTPLKNTLTNSTCAPFTTSTRSRDSTKPSKPS